MTYLYQPTSEFHGSGERGSVSMQIGIVLGADPNKALTMTYSACWSRMMHDVVDKCEQRGVKKTQGGYFTTDEAHGGPVGNDQLFYVNDPNHLGLIELEFNPPAPPEDEPPGNPPPQRVTQDELSGNTYWKPWSANTVLLGMLEVPCYSAWLGHSPDSPY